MFKRVARVNVVISFPEHVYRKKIASPENDHATRKSPGHIDWDWDLGNIG
jgi:hypothetical protein